MRRVRGTALLVWLLIATGAPFARADVVRFPAPNLGTGAQDIVAGPDGNAWFTEGEANKIARITPSGTLTEFTVPTAGALPRHITAGPGGALWFTETGAAKIGRVSTAGAIAEHTIPGPAGDITAGPDGAVWYVRGAHIGRLTPGGVLSEFRVPAAPDEIVAGPDGALWASDYDGKRLFSVTTAGVVTPHPIAQPLGHTDGGPVNLATGPDGRLWYTIAAPSFDLVPRQVGVGRMTTAGAASAYAAARATSQPEGIAGGPDGAVWFTEPPPFPFATPDLPPRIGRITANGSISEFAASARAITAGPGNALWFTDDRVVGRLTTDTPPAAGLSGPLLSTVSPAPRQTGVAADALVVAVFDKAMDKPSAEAALSVVRTRDGARVGGVFAWYGNALILRRDARLPPGTQFTATVGPGAKDAAGQPLENPASWTFSTIGGPGLTSFQPADGAVDQRPYEPVVLAFDEPMDRASTESAFSLKRASDGKPVPGTFSWAYRDVLMGFSPSVALESGTVYTATLSDSARSVSGRALANPTSWRFAATAGPEVIFVSPQDRAIGVSRSTAVVAAFSQPMNKPSAQAAFSLVRASDSAPVGGTSAWYGNALIFVPSSPLQANTAYRATVGTTAQGASGQLLPTPMAWRFTTGASISASPRATKAVGVRRAARAARRDDVGAAMRAARRAAGGSGSAGQPVSRR